MRGKRESILKCEGQKNTVKRLAYYDNLKGFLITLVVIAHMEMYLLGEPYVDALVQFIFLFHMPMFLFVFGLFNKKSGLDSNRWAENVWYFALLYLILYSALYVESHLMGTGWKWFNPFVAGGGETEGGSTAWYLMTLVWYSILIPLLKRTRVWIAMSAAVIMGLTIGFFRIGDQLTCSRTLVFLPFFLLGFHLCPERLVEKLQQITEHKRGMLLRVLVLLLLLGVFLFLCKAPDSWGVFIKEMCKARTGYIQISQKSGIVLPGFCFVAWRIVQYVGTLLLGSAVLLLCPRVQIPLLARVGRHSLPIYVIHSFFLYARKWMNQIFRISSYMPRKTEVLFPIAVSVIIVIAFGYPDWFNRCFKALRKLTVRCLTKEAVSCPPPKN